MKFKTNKFCSSYAKEQKEILSIYFSRKVTAISRKMKKAIDKMKYNSMELFSLCNLKDQEKIAIECWQKHSKIKDMEKLLEQIRGESLDNLGKEKLLEKDESKGQDDLIELEGMLVEVIKDYKEEYNDMLANAERKEVEIEDIEYIGKIVFLEINRFDIMDLD